MDWMNMFLAFVLIVALIVMLGSVVGYRWIRGYWPGTQRNHEEKRDKGATWNTRVSSKNKNNNRSESRKSFPDDNQRKLGESLLRIESVLQNLDQKLRSTDITQNAILGVLKQILEQLKSRTSEPPLHQAVDRQTQVKADHGPRKIVLIDKDNKQSDPAPSHTELESIKQAYNAGVGSRDSRDQFISRYRPIRIGIANSSERARNTEIAPTFANSDQGEYLAAKVDGIQSRFAVFPLYDLSIDGPFLVRSGMDLVFERTSILPGKNYFALRVLRPAVFALRDGTHWNLIDPGRLELGDGE